MNYYNEFDKGAAQWLRNLIAAKLIPAGEVDERDIRLVQAEDLRGFAQCHFFAGIGGWSLALKLAGWPEDRPVWSGSCPCQPFSVCGKRRGNKDDRHVWPELKRLIAVCRPPVVFGEQVASNDGLEWLSGVQTDLEAEGYAVGRTDLPAAGIAAPHIRQRLWWVADSEVVGLRENGVEAKSGRWKRPVGPDDLDVAVGLVDSDRNRTEWARTKERVSDAAGETRRLGYPIGQGLQGGKPEVLCGTGRREEGRATAEPGAAPGYWDAFDVIPCADGKARRLEPGTFPLAHGVPGRVVKLRAYGNAIVPQVAAKFIEAYLDVIHGS